MSDEAQKAVETAKSVRAVVVEVECPHCHGRKRLPGGKYVDQGEVVNCAACSGKGTVRSSIPIEMLYDLLMGNIAAVPRPSCLDQAPPGPGADPLPSLCSLPVGHTGNHEEHLGGRINRTW